MAPPEPVAAMIDVLAAATSRLLATLDGIDEVEVLRQPSALPGWSRAHVLAHLARNADGLRNVLATGRTGRSMPMYPSAEVRAADIDASASRPLEVTLVDVRAASERLAIELDCFPDDRWDAAAGAQLSGQSFTASVVPRIRLCEVEAHHVDLDLGYGFDRSPADAAAAFLDQVPSRFADALFAPARLVALDHGRTWDIGPDAPDPVVIEGTGGALLAWALGRRAAGDDLTSSTGSVPASPGWG